MNEENSVTRGERGPAGDKGAHGQMGDVGLQGDVGERGDRGQQGQRGDTGPEGKSSLLARHVSVSFVLIVVVTTLVLGVFGYTIRQNHNLIGSVDRQQNEIQRIAHETHNALCTFRLDLQKRHDDAVTYLEQHPRGVISPVTDAIIITRAEIQRSIAGQEATLKALGGLNCE